MVNASTSNTSTSNTSTSNTSANNNSANSFEKELVKVIKQAMPQIGRAPRWIAEIGELPANLQANEVFLWRSAEKAEPPRLLNDPQQSINIEITILFAIVKNPRSNEKSLAILETLKQQLRKTMQGWIPQEDQYRQFLPVRLYGGAHLATRDGRELWAEKITCQSIQKAMQ